MAQKTQSMTSVSERPPARMDRACGLCPSEGGDQGGGSAANLRRKPHLEAGPRPLESCELGLCWSAAEQPCEPLGQLLEVLAPVVGSDRLHARHECVRICVFSPCVDVDVAAPR